MPSTPKVRGDGVAAALDGQLDDVLGVEVGGVLGEAGAGGVLDALVDRQDRQVAGAGQAAVAEQPLEVAEHAGVAVAGGEDAVDEIGAGQVQRLLGDRLADVREQAVGLGAEKLADGGRHGRRLSDARPAVAVPRRGRTPPSGPRSGMDAIETVLEPSRPGFRPRNEQTQAVARSVRSNHARERIEPTRVARYRRPRGNNRIEPHHKAGPPIRNPLGSRVRMPVPGSGTL